MASHYSTLVHFVGHSEQRATALKLLTAALAPDVCQEDDDGRVLCQGTEENVRKKLALLTGWQVWVSPADEQKSMDQLAGAMAMTSACLLTPIMGIARLVDPRFFDAVPWPVFMALVFGLGMLVGLAVSTLILPRKPRVKQALLSIRLKRFS
jgi:hypothetical protein